WRELPGGWVLVWLMTFATGFPPVIGYSSSVTIAGFVFGFPGGWPIVASATVVGSTAAFLTSRTIFAKYVHALVGTDKRFVALGQVLRRDGLLVLAAIRFCPLPYSLSNGFLATIPSISPFSFAAATALATPKLLVHVFIGSRLAQLA
ncbi:VTT domain-containing protein, partial [Erythrobacter sp. YJ-T3-07]|nr:VTT domain-containing protein [Erythrobacter sp. YJ-T3-07]